MQLTDTQYDLVNSLLCSEDAEASPLDVGALVSAGVIWEAWGPGHGWAVTGYGAAVAVMHGYRGSLSSVVCRPGTVQRPTRTRGNPNADKRINN